MKRIKEIIFAAVFFGSLIAAGVYGNTCGPDGNQNCHSFVTKQH